MTLEGVSHIRGSSYADTLDELLGICPRKEKTVSEGHCLFKFEF